MVRKLEKNLPKERVDNIDRQILRILMENARIKLTALAREIHLSVDSTKKRLQKMERNATIRRYTINVDPGQLGLPLGIHVYIKLKDLSKETYDAFVKELLGDYHVIILLGLLGEYDLYITFMVKDTPEMEKIKMELKQKFGSIIGDWQEMVVSKVYLLEDFRVHE